MTLAYDIAGSLPNFRAEAEARMTQTWRVGRLVESSDPVTNDVVKMLDSVYTGPGRFKNTVPMPTSREVAGQFISVQTQELHLPSGTTGVEVDMLAVCDACPEDASLVGRVMRIKGLPAAGQTTAARFPAEESGEVFEEGS